MSTFNYSKRRFFLQQIGAAASALLLPHQVSSQPRMSQNPFTLGVASGSPTADSLVLWTRLLLPDYDKRQEAVPIAVSWELAHDEQFSRLAQKGIATASATWAHSVHVEVEGLEADRWYFYRFRVGEHISALGRTRTFPKPEAEVKNFRLAYASCQKWEDGYFTAWRHMKDERLDAVMFLGDYIYEYPALSSRIRTPTGGWVLTLNDYRQRYALYKSDADLQAMHAACPWLMTWDDHEVQNDYAGLQGGFSSNSDPSDPAQFLLRRAAAYQAYYEHMPIRASALKRSLAGLVETDHSGTALRIYSQVHFGQLASLYLLDARQYRDPQVCNKNQTQGSSILDPALCPSWNNPQRTLLGQGQEQWLTGEFAKTSSTSRAWHVMGQSTLFGQRDFKVGPGQMLWNDGWDGYAGARTRLTDSLQKYAVSNPVFLGGDVHENWVGHVKANYADPSSATVGVEFCGTSITSRSGGNARLHERLAENPHFVFADAQRKGYGVVEFTPAQLTTTLRVVDDVTQKVTQIQTLASFTVENGRSFVEQA